MELLLISKIKKFIVYIKFINLDDVKLDVRCCFGWCWKNGLGLFEKYDR